ncbi:MAG: PCP reductase family protein [Planctomycetota bacterium]|nr:PCP reductase family protein [Planctomycetota bacterium]
MNSSLRSAAPVLGLFAFAWLVRWLFVSASPDGLGPFSPYYKGDAPLWLAYAASLQQGQPFGLELGLPLRPPGNAWLVDAVWDGSVEGLPALRSLFVFLGACAVPLTYMVAASLGRSVAVTAAALVAVSFSAIQLAASPNVEAPYLVLALLTVWASQRARVRRGFVDFAFLGLAFGFGCLFRAEHLLLGLGLLGWAMRGASGSEGVGRPWSLGAGSVVVAAVVLAPWHVSAWARVSEFNRVELPVRSARTLPWTDDAVAAVDGLPGFARADAQRLIEDTARHRGAGAVSLQEVAVLDEAFGWRPEPLSERFLVALYGPLNFYLGQTGGPGFRRDALQRLPALAGGEDRYPIAWLRSLPPPGGLSFGYPPHLRPVVHGYADGMGVLLGDLPHAVGLIGEKVWIALRGAASGLGGWNIPCPGSLVRARVDASVATGALGVGWSIVVLACEGFGLWRGRSRFGELVPFLWWAGAGLLVVAAFFGYARLGAILVPVLGVLVGLGLEPVAQRYPRVAARALVVVLAAILVADSFRWGRGVRVLVDGAEVQTVEPWPPLEFEDRKLEVRIGAQDG